MSIAQVAALMGMPAASAHEILGKAGLKTTGKVETRQTIQAIVAEIRTRADRSRDPAVRNRTDAALAKSAEIKAAKALGELTPASEAHIMIRDFIAQTLQIITTAKLTTAEKEGILKKLRTMKIE